MFQLTMSEYVVWIWLCCTCPMKYKHMAASSPESISIGKRRRQFLFIPFSIEDTRSLPPCWAGDRIGPLYVSQACCTRWLKAFDFLLPLSKDSAERSTFLSFEQTSKMSQKEWWPLRKKTETAKRKKDTPNTMRQIWIPSKLWITLKPVVGIPSGMEHKVILRSNKANFTLTLGWPHVIFPWHSSSFLGYWASAVD